MNNCRVENLVFTRRGDEAEFNCSQSLTVDRWEGGESVADIDMVAEEVPVAMVYNGISHAVMLASPSHLEDFATGFSLTEGIVSSRSDIYDIEVAEQRNGIEVQLTIASERMFKLKERRRNLTGRTGCGLCGTESLAGAVRAPVQVPGGRIIAPQALHAAFAGLARRQQLHQATGAVHAAAWACPDGSVVLVREDVGRHNALDKLIGAMARQGIDSATGFLVVTSRASYEMVQKSMTSGISLLAAISAPTGLAVRLAEAAGMTLVGFARRGAHVIYTHAQRIATPKAAGDCLLAEASGAAASALAT